MRSSRMVAVAAVSVGLVLAAADPALAGIRFTKIQYESPGPDTGSNASLDAEFVVIKNTGAHTKQLRGWKLIDKRTGTEGGDEVFRFPRFRLHPGAIVRIHTGRGARTHHDLYWGKSHYVWGDDADTAYLKNRAGRQVDSCAYVSHTQETSPPATC